jgi:hypothetical protein
VTAKRASAHLLQEGFVAELLEQRGLADCDPSPTPCRSGFVIDRIPADSEPPSTEFIAQCQLLVGGLTWIHISTRPDVGVAHKLLCAHLQTPSTGHMTAAKHALCYLKGSAFRGIRFSSDGDHGELTAFYQCPIDCTGKASACCDANWGPQDASNRDHQARPHDNRQVTIAPRNPCGSNGGCRSLERVPRETCESQFLRIGDPRHRRVL